MCVLRGVGGMEGAAQVGWLWEMKEKAKDGACGVCVCV